MDPNYSIAFHSAVDVQGLQQSRDWTKPSGRIWKIGIPNKIKNFLWLLLQDKLNTTENLQNKGWPSTQHCVLCNNGSAETRLHLFQTCRFTTAIILCRIGAARLHDGNFITGYEEAWRSNKQRAWTSIMWEIWKKKERTYLQTRSQLKLQGSTTHSR
jgi:zinc-binding in reverse transcriptase